MATLACKSLSDRLTVYFATENKLLIDCGAGDGFAKNYRIGGLSPNKAYMDSSRK